MCQHICSSRLLQHAATRCNTWQQHAATHEAATHECSRCIRSGRLQYTATRCNTLQHAATHGNNTLQHAATHEAATHECLRCRRSGRLQYTATRCNTLERVRNMCSRPVSRCVDCNTSQHTATDASDVLHDLLAMRCSALQCTVVCCSVLQCVAARCSALQHVAKPLAAFHLFPHVVACCNVLHCVLQCMAVSCKTF